MTEPSESQPAPWVDVMIEVPRWSFLKRGASGEIDFVSPLPCPFNYGAVPDFVGLEGDLLDAIVLGPRLAFGARVRMRAWGAITLIDRGMEDDKLVCSAQPLDPRQELAVRRFFTFYARCKGLLNALRGRTGRNACGQWRTASQAIARTRPREPGWRGPSVRF